MIKIILARTHVNWQSLKNKKTFFNQSYGENNKPRKSMLKQYWTFSKKWKNETQKSLFDCRQYVQNIAWANWQYSDSDIIIRGQDEAFNLLNTLKDKEWVALITDEDDLINPKAFKIISKYYNDDTAIFRWTNFVFKNLRLSTQLDKYCCGTNNYCITNHLWGKIQDDETKKIIIRKHWLVQKNIKDIKIITLPNKNLTLYNLSVFSVSAKNFYANRNVTSYRSFLKKMTESTSPTLPNYFNWAKDSINHLYNYYKFLCA
jgi:hypothetical protein